MEWLSDLWESTADLRAQAATAIAESWAYSGRLLEQAMPALRDTWDGTADLRRNAGAHVADFGGWLAGFDLNLSRDAAIALSVLLLILSLAAIVSAWVDRRVPWIGLLLLVCGGLLTLWTTQTYPEGFAFEDIPLAFIEVIATIVN